jgi:hypothetical protein
MMPRTSDAVPDYKPLCERPKIMTAMRIDGENLGAGAHQQNVLIADVAEQAFAGEAIYCNALSEI